MCICFLYVGGWRPDERSSWSGSPLPWIIWKWSPTWKESLDSKRSLNCRVWSSTTRAYTMWVDVQYSTEISKFIGSKRLDLTSTLQHLRAADVLTNNQGAFKANVIWSITENMQNRKNSGRKRALWRMKLRSRKLRAQSSTSCVRAVIPGNARKRQYESAFPALNSKKFKIELKEQYYNNYRINKSQKTNELFITKTINIWWRPQMWSSVTTINILD